MLGLRIGTGSQISGSCLRGSVMGPLPTAFSSGWLPSSTRGLCFQIVGFTSSVKNQDAGETGVTLLSGRSPVLGPLSL